MKDAYAERIQTPSATVSDHAQNSTEVIREHDGGEPAAVTQTSGLENFLLLIQKDLCSVGSISRDGFWILPCATLVDLEQLGGDILGDRS